MDEFNGEWNQFNHASIFLFEKFMQMEFKTGLHPDIYEYWNTVNSFYNEKLFYKDFNNEESVRTFIIYGKNGFEKELITCLRFSKNKCRNDLGRLCNDIAS